MDSKTDMETARKSMTVLPMLKPLMGEEKKKLIQVHIYESERDFLDLYVDMLGYGSIGGFLKVYLKSVLVNNGYVESGFKESYYLLKSLKNDDSSSKVSQIDKKEISIDNPKARQEKSRNVDKESSTGNRTNQT